MDRWNSNTSVCPNFEIIKISLEVQRLGCTVKSMVRGPFWEDLDPNTVNIPTAASEVGLGLRTVGAAAAEL